MSVVLDRIAKSFGATRVLEPFSLSIATGELLALLGPSGCGKTTTLRMIAGLERPDSGRVEIEGKDVTALPPERRGLGMVFQHYAIWPHRTIGANVAYPLERAGVAKTEIAGRVAEALELVHLASFAERRPHQMSGGQLQRVALARALVARPRVLLLDEPLSNLDAGLREEMRAEIRSLQRRLKITTVLVTHDQQEALSIADRVAVMHAGALEQLGPPDEIYARPATAFVAGFVGGGNVFEAQCDGARLSIASLAVAAPAGTRAGAARAVVRPEEIHLARDGEPGAEAIVRERLYLGDRVELRLEMGGTAVRALVPVADAAAAAPDAKVRLTFSRAHVLPA